MTASTNDVSMAITFRSNAAIFLEERSRIDFGGTLEFSGTPVARFETTIVCRDGYYDAQTFLQPLFYEDFDEDLDEDSDVDSDELSKLEAFREQMMILENPISVQLLRLFEAWEKNTKKPQPGLAKTERIEFN